MNFKFTKKKTIIFVSSIVAFSVMDAICDTHVAIFGIIIVILYLSRLKDEV